MKLLQLHCPACGSALEAEDDLDMFYCKYCGHKIILTDQDKSRLEAKVAMKKMDHDERVIKMEAEEKRKEFIRSVIGVLIPFAILFLVMIFCAIMSHFYD